MPSPLGSLFSTIDSAKRKVMDALMNPGATLENLVNEKNQAAGEHLDDLRLMGRKPQIPADRWASEAAGNRVLETLANGYNPAGIFVGARAKGIDNIALAYAMKDARKGRPADEIWQERGWGKGPDGNWRTELDDSGKGFVFGHSGELARSRAQEYYQLLNGRSDGALIQHPASYVFPHPALYKAYPQLEQLQIEARVDPKLLKRETGASFAPGNQVFRPRIEARATSEADANKFGLHEFQHAVQEIENWQGGGSPTNFRTSDPQQAFKLYQRLGGEAEARLVEYRSQLSADQRKQLFPFGSGYNGQFFQGTGVLPEDLILARRRAADGTFPLKP